MLEEYEKSEIVNNAYMRRIMQVLENIKETKKIISKQNKFILQISDGKDSVNIYQKGKCYCINLNGTNFSSIVAAEGGAYLYKNKKLDIEYRLSEVILNDTASKRTSFIKVKDFESVNSYIDDNGNYIFIYNDEPGLSNEKITIYDKALVNLDEHALSNFLEVKNNIVKDEIQEQKEEKEELPQNIEEFDYSKYEEEKENEQKIADEIENAIDSEQFYEEQMEDMEEFYKNYVCMIDGEVVNGEERIPFIQELYSTMQESDDQFLEISESIEEIITTYESELNKFEVKVESKKNESNSKIQKEQDDGPEQ
jgi:hypothetical protein